MIYLIQVEYKTCTLLKIGYTKDSNKDKRFIAYKLHNPLSEILFTIPGGTEKHEKYFKLVKIKVTLEDKTRENGLKLEEKEPSN